MENQGTTEKVYIESKNEYERERVPDSKLKGLRSFVGMFAGEHAAGTEFMIGPLFVVHGVSAFDVVFGLLFGNLLAVLSWTLLCAPIAVKVRHTLYYQLERICGIHLVNFYNLLNGLLFCFLAGAMIAVSATAVGIPFDMKMPELDDMLPNSVGWIISVIGVGAVISIVAMKGYEAVARFSTIAAPWMILVFLSAGIAVLPELGVNSLSDFWKVANEKIWTGVPLEGQSKFGFWHITFFGWFANMAMHIGMADMSIFRYAKKSSYGLSSAAGMYVGHFMAWIAAGILYALQLNNDPSNTAVAPGPMAYNAVGFAGLVCVIVAGWTTANPTIYRAGLAFQTLFPKWSRAKVTLLAGAIATFGGCFPGLVMELLGFVALYGLLLMPMGTIIFIDHYLMSKIGLKSNYAEVVGNNFFNWAAAIAWVTTLGVCFYMNSLMGIEVFFLGLPGWFIAAVLYLAFSKMMQKKTA